ncbi:MAG: class I SAM-dependent methyltransferase [Gammaproteobacteria bacterium]|nr:class I SAM-dependent methyltransferase [Gammaproteobacteria bacterium]
MSSLYLPLSLNFEPRHLVISTWMDHLPFGYDLVAALRPSCVVELGTYSGLSFFTFCQSMIENDVEGIAYAIDTWEGDEHTGNYGDSIFRQVDDHARDYYRGISYLLRMRFSEAANQFDKESIDLLHIDGLHTYDAVREDFETWYPKVKPGGIVLFHDIEARMPGFGVRKFWQELSGINTCFAFTHGYGLGVLKKPGGSRPLSKLESLLFEGDEETRSNLRKLYVHVGRHIDAMRRVRKQEA